MSQSEDMDAVDQFFRTTPAATQAAQGDAQSWRTWFDGLSWYSKSFDDAAWTEAKRRRDQFNRDNGAPDLKAQGFDQITKEDIAAGKGLAALQTVPTSGMLKKGSRGPAVSKLQRALGISDDGNFGPGTEKAVKAFQSSHGITPDGIAGPQTLGVLYGGGSTAAAAPPPAMPVSAGQYSTIMKGNQGADVAHWQTLIGISPADGIFGDLTDARTKAWQSAHGIQPDGVVGPQTWNAAISAAHAAGSPVAPPAPGKPAPVKKSAYAPPPPKAKIPPVPSQTKKVGAPKAPVPPKPSVLQAGFLSNLSTPVKILGGVGIAGAIVHMASSGKKRHQ